jgi:Transglycosylase SLT domain
MILAFFSVFSLMSKWNPIRTTVRSVAIVVVATLAMAAALPCLASEVAVLKNGFTITHERREIVGEVTRLYVKTDGESFVDVPTTEIDHFEAAPDPPKSAIPPFAKNAKDGAPGTQVSTPRASLASGFAARPKADLNQVVNDASDRYRLDPDLVNSVIKAESGFNVRAISPKGAQGLMQLMPGTAAELGVPNTFDAEQNVEGGTRYLRELLERYNFDLVKALAAYNAGPQRVEQFGGVPPYYETRAYVARIVRDFNKKKMAQGKVAAGSQKSAASQNASVAKTAGAKTSSAKAQPSAAKPRSTGSLAQASSAAAPTGVSSQK